jgi:hypothetical protein
LMDIHHDTSLKFILEDDSISLTFRVRIHFYSAKGIKLWLVIRPCIYLFHITHYTFSLALRFHLGLIQPSTFNLFTCEFGHGLDTFGTHLVCCSFGGQRITTHDVIWDIMCAFAQKNGHVIWGQQWCSLTWRISLWTDFYMTQEDHVFIVDVVVTNLTWETVTSSVINRPKGAMAKLSAITKIRKYRRLHEGLYSSCRDDCLLVMTMN